jgi:hypothetical protein
MTRKDYTLIALAFQDQKKFMEQFPLYYDAKQKQAIEDQMRDLAYNIAGTLKIGNPGFDRPWFLNACGYPTGGYGYDESVALPDGESNGVRLSATVSVSHYD